MHLIYLDKDTTTLVSLTLAGNQQAYEALVLRYQRAAISSAARVTRNEYMAEDAAQDAFVAAWLKLNTLREPEKFGAWVCRIAKNCARNIMARYREYISFDLIENQELETGECVDENLLQISEEESPVSESVNRLPEKVKKVIKLHYFEGYSVAEIAAILAIPAGTVKYQLHEGRKKMRKELCAMTEKENDTLVQRVMKKVEELKLWRLRNNKDGFEEVYKETLAEVEELPESKEKQGMLADVLMRGCWWIPGAQNDEIMARIKAAAIESLNEEVMQFICANENDKFYGKKLIEFMRDVEIPFLEENGFVKARGYEWFWLAREYFEKKDYENGFAALEEVLALLEPSDVYYANAISAREMERFVMGKPKKECGMLTMGEVYRKIGDRLYFWKQPGYGRGDYGHRSKYVFSNAAACDSLLYDEIMKVGDVYRSTDGKSTLTFLETGVTVETPCGIFEGCEVWLTDSKERDSYTKTYYKDGIGIVKSEHNCEDDTETRTLKSYKIVGGIGKIPFAAGNRWEYDASNFDSRFYDHKNVFEITSFDGKEAVASVSFCFLRKAYDETNFADMMSVVRNCYWDTDENGNEYLCDVSPFLEKAEKAAKTPFQKTYYAAASSVARRIMETDETLNPNRTASGHWNFFQYIKVKNEGGKITGKEVFDKDFEWKMVGNNKAACALLYNFIYDIIQNVTGALWNEEWRDGFYLKETRNAHGRKIETEISCSDERTVTTAAGEFQNCLLVDIKVSGLEKTGWAYQGGHKEYYFAPGVGIVRMVAHRYNYTIKTVYDLVKYVGTGEGYMPLEEGFLRRYEAQDLADGYVASTEYTFAKNENGELIMFSNQEGIKKLVV